MRSARAREALRSSSPGLHRRQISRSKGRSGRPNGRNLARLLP
jgi:hypothetical protein